MTGIAPRAGRQQARLSRFSRLPSRHLEKLATGISIEVLPNPIEIMDP